MNKSKLILLSILCASSMSVFAKGAYCYLKKELAYCCKETDHLKNSSWTAYWSNEPSGDSSCKGINDENGNEVNACDYTSRATYAKGGVTLYNDCINNTGGGAVIDKKINRVCIYPNDQGNIPPYKFLAWSYLDDDKKVYTSQNVITNLNNTNSSNGQLERDDSYGYQWTEDKTEDNIGHRYHVVKNISHNSKATWQVYKDGRLKAYNARCMLYTDLVRLGLNLPINWNKENYTSLPSY